MLYIYAGISTSVEVGGSARQMTNPSGTVNMDLTSSDNVHLSPNIPFAHFYVLHQVRSTLRTEDEFVVSLSF
jgi:hypothetical protein